MRSRARARARVVAAALVLGGLALVFVPMPAQAATVTKSGWWFRAKTATPTAESPQPIPGGNPVLPTLPVGPPTVAADQLHVEGTPEGATAIAAFTFELQEGESLPVLTLKTAPGSNVPPTAVILACRAAVDWAPPAAEPGAWDEKPLVDCFSSVQAQINETGDTLVFPLQPLARGTELDIVIVPGTVPDVPPDVNGSAFSLTFTRPAADALVTTRATPTSDFSPETDFSEDFSFEPAAPTETFSAPLDAPTFDSTVVTAAPPVAAPALEPQDQAPSVPRTITPQPVAAVDVGGAARKLGLVLIALGIIAAYMASAERPVAETGLGRFRRIRTGEAAVGDEAPVEGGIGRLRRPRVGPAPSL